MAARPAGSIAEREAGGRAPTPPQTHSYGGIYSVERVLYRLPELLAADPAEPVYIVEGEKDVDALVKLGLIATTNSGGAGKWHESYNHALVGRVVIILPDNDKPGREHAEHLSRSLLDSAASVRVLHLPDLSAKGDVYDWLATGGTVADLATLAEAAPLVDARFSPKGSSDHRGNQQAKAFVLTPLAELMTEPVEIAEWVVAEMMPTAGSSLVVAKPKVGKTTLVRNLALAVARGDTFLGRSTKQGPVLYLALEEKRGKVREHFALLGATVDDRVPLFVHVGSAPPKPLAHLESLINQHHPVLVIIDPLQRFLHLQDGNNYSEVSNAMEPLGELARSLGPHILCVHHANKGGQGGGDSVLGSTAFWGAVDTLVTLRRKDNARSIETQQRYGEDLEETALILDPRTQGSMLGSTATERLVRDVDEDIIQAVRDGASTEAEIRLKVGGDQTLTAKRLRALVESGRLVRKGTGKRGNPFKYSLPAEEHGEGRQHTLLDGRWDPMDEIDHRESDDTDDYEEQGTWVG